MTRSLIPAAALAALVLTGCIATPAAPPPSAAGASVSHLGRAYPIEATAYGWQMQVDGARVACRAPTVEDCYWSLRNHRTAQARLADIE